MSDAALLVIDVQRGAFDGARCPPIDGADVLVDNTGRLVAAARAGGVPVVFVRHCEGAGAPFEGGSPHGELHEALVPRAGEAVVAKRASSSFEETDLATVLAQTGATKLILCGLQSEFCVSNTAKAALERGFHVTIAADGHGTWSSPTGTAAELARNVNRDLEARGARVQDTALLVRALRGAKV